MWNRKRVASCRFLGETRKRERFIESGRGVSGDDDGSSVLLLAKLKPPRLFRMGSFRKWISARGEVWLPDSVDGEVLQNQ